MQTRSDSTQIDTTPRAEPGAERLGGIVHSVVPVWSGQIDMARAQVEDAAINLVGYFVGIAGRIDQIGGTLARAEDTLAELLQISAQEKAEGVVSRAPGTIDTLKQDLDAVHKEREEISVAVKRGIIALQFQDRISQVLNSVVRDLEKLRQRVDTSGHLPDDFDVGAWLDELMRTYSMKEQFAVHQGDAPAAHVDDGDITMF